MVATLKVDTITEASNTGTANISLDSSGNVTIGNNLTVNGTTTQTGSTTFTAQTLFPDGSVSAPSISNTGDVNTGVYFPAADNVAIATGGVAALTADSSQNVSVTNTLVMGSSFKRNRIINGDMRIDQRNAGASASCPASSITYVLDRWFLFPSGATLTAQQVSGTNTGTINAFRITGATGSTACNFEQRIENLNIQDLASKTITAKVKVYCSSSISNVTLYALSPTSANNYAAITTSFSTSITLNSGLNTITVTGTLDANAIYGQAIGIGFNSGIGNGVTVDISEFQVEQGSIATPYERQIYSDQLAQCQRYLPAIITQAGNTGDVGVGVATATTSGAIFVTFMVTPRVAPTGATVNNVSSFSATTNAAVSTATAITFYNAGLSGSRLAVVGTGTPYVANSTFLLFGNGSATVGSILFTGCEL